MEADIAAKAIDLGTNTDFSLLSLFFEFRKFQKQMDCSHSFQYRLDDLQMRRLLDVE